MNRPHRTSLLTMFPGLGYQRFVEALQPVAPAPTARTLAELEARARREAEEWERRQSCFFGEPKTPDPFVSQVEEWVPRACDKETGR